MGQIKGNPSTTRSVQNQAYSNLYTNNTSQTGADRRDMGVKPVLIDDQTTLNEYVDITFDTDYMAALVSSSINTTIGAVSSSISSSINLTISVPGTYANDAAAQAAGVRIGGLYHTSGTVKVRLV